VQAIKQHDMRAGVSLNPATPVGVLEEILPDLDLVLVMSVNPGFGGQSFIPASTAKIGKVREMLRAAGLDHIELEVDGGIGPSTSRAVVAAGATVLVAGAAVFGGASSVAENIRAIRSAAV
jgi:ribulose-phosphate 3-epimerase